MKKLFSLVCAFFISITIFAQNLTLSMADCGETKWGEVSINGNEITFGPAWECGIGWWLGGGPLTAYHRVTLTYEAFDGQVALSVGYDESGSDFAQAIGTAGGTKVSIDLDPTKSAHVYKIWIQTSKMGKLTVKSCVVEGGADPLDLTGKTEVVLNQEPGENCVKVFQEELERLNPNDVVVCTLNCLNASKELGWGIGKIVAMDDWTNSQYDMMNKCNGLGISEYKFLVSDLIGFAKKGGTEWYIGPESGVAGVIFNSYGGDSEIVSVKCYSANPQGVENTQVQEKAHKVIEDGMLYIIKNGVKYNALGSPVR